jgi:hypothetical protein
MKKPFLKVALIPAVLLLAFASGCNLVESPSGGALSAKGGVVLQETFCVTFDCVVTSGDDITTVTSSSFATEIQAWLDANDVDPEDVCDIFQSGGTIVLAAPYSGGHDWDWAGKLWIKRLDIVDDWHLYLKAQTVTIPDDIAPGYNPRFNFRGVRTVNRALEDLVAGQNPILGLEMRQYDGDIDPEPSESDPLEFTWDACINVVVVVGNNCH